MSKNDYTNKIVPVIESFFEKEGWEYSTERTSSLEDISYIFDLSVEGVEEDVSYTVSVDSFGYIVSAVYPIAVDPEDTAILSLLAVLICYANNESWYGYYDICMDDGRIEYICTVDCSDIVPSVNMVWNSMYVPAIMFQRWSSGINDVITGKTPVKEAVEKCKRKPDVPGSLINGCKKRKTRMEEMDELFKKLFDFDDETICDSNRAKLKIDIFRSEGDDD